MGGVRVTEPLTEETESRRADLGRLLRKRNGGEEAELEPRATEEAVAVGCLTEEERR
jgi:hypothetical protein